MSEEIVAGSRQSTVTDWIDRVKQGRDEEAARKLWDRFVVKVVALARQRLYSRANLAEDVGQEAMIKFFKAVENGSAEALTDRDSLWSYIAKIVRREAIDTHRGDDTKKRGKGWVQAIGGDDIGQVPNPSDEDAETFNVVMADLMAVLSGHRLEAELLPIAMWKLAGFSNLEISKKLHCAQSTVENRIKEIRTLWGRV